ncbi:MAG: murein biosynthesis integral membrane protein MurJ, partial [Clostridiaceae bacterium]|nr:murein biosynthesis integral membrane protein MurJ [Clostridiaceae bacterium]
MNKAVKTVSFIAFATLLAKAMGMLRDIILAQAYGTSALLDAYMAASRIPVLFFDFTLGAAIISTFIPVYNRYLQLEEHDKANDFANSFITLVFIISLFFAILGMLFSNLIVGITAPGFAPGIRLITSKLLIIMLPSIVFTTLAYSVVGILQSKGEYNIPAIISLVSNAVVIFYLVFLNQRYSILGLAVAMLIGWGIQVFVQVPSLIKKKFRYKFILDIKNEGIKDVFVLSVPV